MADLQPSSHVREKSGAICKIHAKYSARAARSLAMQIRKSHPESHPWKIQRTQVTSDHIQSHPRVTSGQNSEASHIRVVTSAITSGQNPVTSMGTPYSPGPGSIEKSPRYLHVNRPVYMQVWLYSTATAKRVCTRTAVLGIPPTVLYSCTIGCDRGTVSGHGDCTTLYMY